MNLVIYEADPRSGFGHGLLAICSENLWNNELRHDSHLKLVYTIKNAFISNLSFSEGAKPERMRESGVYIYPKYGGINIELLLRSDSIIMNDNKSNKNNIQMPNLNCNNCIHSLLTDKCLYTNKLIGTGYDVCDKYELIELTTLENINYTSTIKNI